MSWETIRFGDLYAIGSRNGLSKPRKVRGSGYKMINMGELFAHDRIYDIPMELVPLKEKEKINAKVEAGDLLFARQSLVLEGAGKCSIVMEVSPLTVFESHLIRVRLLEEVNPSFYYYYFQSSLSPMKSIVSQCAQAGIRGSDLQELCVLYPPKKTQDRIASMLEQYDSLIENNQKQIKLLEEAAQRLYKEWFVDLNFPGYEDVEIIDGVPEGWKIHPIDDVFQIKYGKTLPTSKISSEGKYPVYGANGIIGFYSEKNIDDYVVLITSRGNGSGDVLITHDKESFITNNSFIVKPINHNVRLPFIHQLMKCTGFKNICTGSAQPQLTNKSISTLCVLMPSYNLISRFCETESVWYEKIEKLLTQNKLLNQARDRLLPKLMSGEIEV
ncbi:MAG: restriction endonuclease subunit S [Lactobacillus iners]|nr:restriction endonuclease subunit S [Lactobacillus iners]